MNAKNLLLLIALVISTLSLSAKAAQVTNDQSSDISTVREMISDK